MWSKIMKKISEWITIVINIILNERRQTQYTIITLNLFIGTDRKPLYIRGLGQRTAWQLHRGLRLLYRAWNILEWVDAGFPTL